MVDLDITQLYITQQSETPVSSMLKLKCRPTSFICLTLKNCFYDIPNGSLNAMISSYTFENLEYTCKVSHVPFSTNRNVVLYCKLE